MVIVKYLYHLTSSVSFSYNCLEAFRMCYSAQVELGDGARTMEPDKAWSHWRSCYMLTTCSIAAAPGSTGLLQALLQLLHALKLLHWSRPGLYWSSTWLHCSPLEQNIKTCNFVLWKVNMGSQILNYAPGVGNFGIFTLGDEAAFSKTVCCIFTHANIYVCF